VVNFHHFISPEENMRLALQESESHAAGAADKEFETIGEVSERASRRISLACTDRGLRTKWMSAYVAAGGKAQEVCGERVATLRADQAPAQIADRVLESRHPELKSRKLTLSHDDRKLRSEWMDLYVEYGGRITYVCEPEHICPE
jgi:hypothetical protein